MNLSRNLFALIFLFVSFQICFTQEKSQAEIIGELTSIGGCENYSSILDLFFVELSRDTNSTGYVVIQGNKDNIIQTIIYKEWAYNHFNFRKSSNKSLKNFDEKRLRVVKGEDSAELKIQFWKVSNRAEKSFEFAEKFDYSLNLKKPLRLFDAYFDGGGLCPALSYKKIYFDFLKNNPDLRGNVVFYESSKSKFNQNKNNFLNQIGDISRDRFRFFQSSNGIEENYEFWLVPRKRK